MSGVAERLRPWDPEDVQFVLDAIDTPDLLRQIVLATPDLAGAADWVQRRASFDPARRRSFVIELAGAPVGEVGLHAIDETHAVASVGYWLVPSARGRGLATRATATLAAWAFDELALERIGLDHRVNNTGSGRVAERAGFTFEGVERARLRYEGVRYDCATYGRLVTDLAPDLELLEVITIGQPLVSQACAPLTGVRA